MTSKKRDDIVRLISHKQPMLHRRAGFSLPFKAVVWALILCFSVTNVGWGSETAHLRKVRLHETGLSDGHMGPLMVRAPMDEDVELDLSDRHDEFIYESKTIKTINNVHKTDLSARVVQADLGDRVGAYHFRPGQKDPHDILIVVNSRMNQGTIHEEGIFHEAREAFWMGKDFTPREAHVIASAEEALKFCERKSLLGKTFLRPTPYHKLQLEELMSRERRVAIEKEDEEMRRDTHHSILLNANEKGGDIDVEEVKRYEEMIRSYADHAFLIRVDQYALDSMDAIVFQYMVTWAKEMKKELGFDIEDRLLEERVLKICFETTLGPLGIVRFQGLSAALLHLGVDLEIIDPCGDRPDHESLSSTDRYTRAPVQEMSYEDNEFGVALSLGFFDPAYFHTEGPAGMRREGFEKPIDFYRVAAENISRALMDKGVFLVYTIHENPLFLKACEEAGFEIIRLDERDNGDMPSYIMINHKSAGGEEAGERDESPIGKMPLPRPEEGLELQRRAQRDTSGAA